MLLALEKIQQFIRRRREQLLTPMDDTDRANQLRHVQRDGGKNTGLDLSQHARLWKDTDAGLNRDGLLDRLDVIPSWH